MGKSFVRRVPLEIKVAALGVVAAAVLCGVYFFLERLGDPPTWDPGEMVGPPSGPPAESVLPAGSYPTEPLPAGAAWPPFEAAGWLNGDLPPVGRLTLVDVWADWCPVCRQSAPGLVAAHRRFGGRLAFVSLSSLRRADVEAFVRQFAVPWPCGYGTTPAAIARLGAYSTDRMSAANHPGLPTYHPGHELNPTLFLVGPDGLILWNDRQARPRHLRDAAGVLTELTAEVERALGSYPSVN